jgi:hypothetical protein
VPTKRSQARLSTTIESNNYRVYWPVIVDLVVVFCISCFCYRLFDPTNAHGPISNLQLTTVCLSLDTSNANKLGLEDEHRVGRDGAHGSGAVARLGLDCECPLLARAHAQNSLVPALDHLALANVERQRLAAVVGCVEFGAVGLEGTAVVDVDFVACLEVSIRSKMVKQGSS